MVDGVFLIVGVLCAHVGKCVRRGGCVMREAAGEENGAENSPDNFFFLRMELPPFETQLLGV